MTNTNYSITYSSFNYIRLNEAFKEELGISEVQVDKKECPNATPALFFQKLLGLNKKVYVCHSIREKFEDYEKVTRIFMGASGALLLILLGSSFVTNGHIDFSLTSQHVYQALTSNMGKVLGAGSFALFALGNFMYYLKMKKMNTPVSEEEFQELTMQKDLDTKYVRKDFPFWLSMSHSTRELQTLKVLS